MISSIRLPIVPAPALGSSKPPQVVTTATTQDSVAPPQPEFNRKEQVSRYSANWIIRLGLNGAPNILAMLGHVVPLPGWLSLLTTGSDLLNVVTSVPSLPCDVHELRGTFKNPLATRTDKVMDCVNFGADILSVAGAATPLLTSVHHPAAAVFFYGTQVLGIGVNAAKTIYDYRRQGQQSAYREGQEAVKHLQKPALSGKV